MVIVSGASGRPEGGPSWAPAVESSEQSVRLMAALLGSGGGFEPSPSRCRGRQP